MFLRLYTRPGLAYFGSTVENGQHRTNLCTGGSRKLIVDVSRECQRWKGVKQRISRHYVSERLRDVGAVTWNGNQAAAYTTALL